MNKKRPKIDEALFQEALRSRARKHLFVARKDWMLMKPIVLAVALAITDKRF